MTMETVILLPEEKAESPEKACDPDSRTEPKEDSPVQSFSFVKASNFDSAVEEDHDIKKTSESDENLVPEAPEAQSNDEPESDVAEEGDSHSVNGLVDDGFEDLPVNASLHAADEMKRRLEEIDPCEKLRSLCKKGEVEELDQFLKDRGENGVDIDYVSSDGWTCLHEIITHGKLIHF